MKYMMGEAIKIILSASHILECFIPKFKDCLIKKDPNICLPRSTFVLQSRCLLTLYLFIVTTPTTMQRNTTSTLQLGWTRKLLCTPTPPTTETQHPPLRAPDEHLLTTTLYDVISNTKHGHNNNINNNKSHNDINNKIKNNNKSSLKKFWLNLLTITIPNLHSSKNKNHNNNINNNINYYNKTTSV